MTTPRASKPNAIAHDVVSSFVCVFFFSVLVLQIGCSKTPTVAGRVIVDGKPIANARVRIKGTTTQIQSDADGRFSLQVAEASLPLTVTATAEGYFIGSCEYDKRSKSGDIELSRLPEHDNESYEWVNPIPDADSSDRCGNCHPEIFEQWNSGAHAQSLENVHFTDLYAGTNRQTETVRETSWSLVRDRPEGIGVCTSCHAPSAELDQLAIGDIRDVHGVAKQGVHCDFCHKVESVSTENIGITHGRFAMKLLRPEHGQLFFGPLDDVDRGEDVYAPDFSNSEYCAACHEGTLFGVHVYGTYSEWLESPARQSGKHCQDCHMKPDGAMTNIAPDFGGIERDPATLASHQLFPGGQAEMLSRALNVHVQVGQPNAAVPVTVTLTATNVGHRVPTGFVDRHLILIVEGIDAAGNPLPATEGPTLTGVAGSLANKNGKLFAKQLFGENGATPVPFWAEVFEQRDTRLYPEKPDESSFRFPPDSDQIRVRVIYRRFWESVEKEKGWADRSIIVYDQLHPVPR
ncbi:MAG: hypothetical protein KDB27_17855 [Planctomycetales bacterium]|nr:hypothetical protein [Planctomycetales bacterium]